MKAMQPDSECNKRARAKPGTPKSSTPRTQKAASTKSSQEICTPTTKNQDKTDDIQKISSSQRQKDKVTIVKGGNSYIDQYFTPIRNKNLRNVVDSPATVFLNKIDSMSASMRKEANELLERNTEEAENVESNVTKIIPVEMDISAILNKTKKNSVQRRQSMRLKPKKVSEELENAIVNEKLAEEPKSTVGGVANMSLTLNEDGNNTLVKTLPMDESINDLCASLSTTCIPAGSIETPKILPFHSARKPGLRRTTFDVSMDIITERLQNINRSSRRSIMPIDILKQNESPTVFKASDNKVENKEADELDNTTPTNKLLKKKRKLFVPNHNDSSLRFGTPPLHSTEISADLLTSSPTTENPLTKLTPRIEKKRRRTILHFTAASPANTKREKGKQKEVTATEKVNVSNTAGNKLSQRRKTIMPITKSTCKDNDNEEITNTLIATKPPSRSRRTLLPSLQPAAASENNVNDEKKKATENHKAANAIISCSAPPSINPTAKEENNNYQAPISNSIDNIKRAVMNRRSTLDFVDETQKQLISNKTHKKVVNKSPCPTKVMVFTNMHRQQSETIQQVGVASFLPTTVASTTPCGENDSTI